MKRATCTAAKRLTCLLRPSREKWPAKPTVQVNMQSHRFQQVDILFPRFSRPDNQPISQQQASMRKSRVSCRKTDCDGFDHVVH